MLIFKKLVYLHWMKNKNTYTENKTGKKLGTHFLKQHSQKSSTDINIIHHSESFRSLNITVKVHQSVSQPNRRFKDVQLSSGVDRLFKESLLIRKQTCFWWSLHPPPPSVRRATSCHSDTPLHTFESRTRGRGRSSPYSPRPDSRTCLYCWTAGGLCCRTLCSSPLRPVWIR